MRIVMSRVSPHGVDLSLFACRATYRNRDKSSEVGLNVISKHPRHGLDNRILNFLVIFECLYI